MIKITMKSRYCTEDTTLSNGTQVEAGTMFMVNTMEELDTSPGPNLLIYLLYFLFFMPQMSFILE